MTQDNYKNYLLSQSPLMQGTNVSGFMNESRGGLTSVRSHKKLMGGDGNPVRSKQESERDMDQPDEEPNDSVQ